MKRNKFLAVTGLLIASSLLASCQQNIETPVKKEIDFNGAVLQNVKLDEHTISPVNFTKHSVVNKTLSSLDRNFGNAGVYTNVVDGKLTFHSVVFDNFLNGRTFYEMDIESYSVRNTPIIGQVVDIKTTSKMTMLYDRYGNEIYNGPEDFTRLYIFKAIVSGSERTIYRLTTNEYGDQYFYFDKSGAKINVSSLGHQNNTEEEVFGAKNAEEVGLKEHYYIINKNNSNDKSQLVSIYDKAFKGVSTFAIPEKAEFKGVVDGKYFYQDFKNYNVDYKDQYALASYVVDVTTGEQKPIKLDYLLTSPVLPFKDNVGEFTLGFAKVKLVLEDGSLANEEKGYIIDKDGSLLKDVTGIEPTSFIKASEETIFNTATNTLYTNNLKPVMDLGTNFTYISELGYVVGTYNNKFGAYDLNLEETIPFTYDYLSQKTLNGNLVGLKNGQVYLVNSQTVTEVDLNHNNIERIDITEDGLFIAKRKTYKTLISPTGKTYWLEKDTPILSIYSDGAKYSVYKLSPKTNFEVNEFVTIKTTAKE